MKTLAAHFEIWTLSLWRTTPRKKERALTKDGAGQPRKKSRSRERRTESESQRGGKKKEGEVLGFAWAE